MLASPSGCKEAQRAVQKPFGLYTKSLTRSSLHEVPYTKFPTQSVSVPRILVHVGRVELDFRLRNRENLVLPRYEGLHMSLR